MIRLSTMDEDIGAQLQRLQDEFIALQNSTQAISEEQAAQIESLISENESLKTELTAISHVKQDLLVFTIASSFDL